RFAKVRADGWRTVCCDRHFLVAPASAELSVRDLHRCGPYRVRRGLATRIEIHLHRLDDAGFHSRVCHVERDPGTVLFLVRHTDRIAGPSISTRFSRAHMGSAGCEYLDLVCEIKVW